MCGGWVVGGVWYEGGSVGGRGVDGCGVWTGAEKELVVETVELDALDPVRVASERLEHLVGAEKGG